jgi:hypothetical protein
VTRRIVLGAAALLFAIVATANSGGYRFGVSDQAFYVPALARGLDPGLFPRDSDVLEVQTRLWAGDEVLTVVSRVSRLDLPALSVALYVLGLVLLAWSVVFLVRGLGGSWWAVAAGLALLTLRHRIPRTGANSLEGYFHPRMIAFAIGLCALGFLLRRRSGVAFGLVALAAVAHPTTAVWFGAVVVIAAACRWHRRTLWVIAGAGAAACAWLAVSGPRMDASWLAVFAAKDYVFPSQWPAYAWAVNLAYPVVLWALYRRRAALAMTVPGEPAIVVALLVLVAGFGASVVLSAAHVAPVVQLQVPRVFWVLDAVALLYVAWWIVDDVAMGVGARWRAVAVALLLTAAFARGYYVLVVEHRRPLVTVSLAPTPWTDAMRFLRSQPVDALVLADPGHALKYGSSVRAAALRDVVLEHSKDSAMAMYDRALAMRVADRMHALSGFEEFGEEQIRAVARRYRATVLVVEKGRQLRFPVLYENARFVVHSLR